MAAPYPAPLLAHLSLLEKWRGAMDLVGPGPLAPHFDDAIAAVGWLKAEGEWVDLGSGAGFPGVALAAMFPSARVTLVERRQKRAVFLREVAAATKLPNLTVIEGDSADLPAAAYDGVISRAYKPPPEVLVDAARIAKPSGVCVLLLAREDAPLAPAWEVFHVERYVIEGKNRSAVGMRRVGW